MNPHRVRITLEPIHYGPFKREADRFGLSVPAWMRSICIRQLVEGVKTAVADSEPLPEPGAPHVCTFDEHAALESTHYRRGYDDCMRDLIAQGRVKPKIT